jgi:hypothetical protein
VVVTERRRARCDPGVVSRRRGPARGLLAGRSCTRVERSPVVVRAAASRRRGHARRGFSTWVRRSSWSTARQGRRRIGRSPDHHDGRKCRFTLQKSVTNDPPFFNGRWPSFFTGSTTLLFQRLVDPPFFNGPRGPYRPFSAASPAVGVGRAASRGPRPICR